MMMGIFKLNLDYQEILRLDSMLNIAKIPHIRHRMFDGWKIAYIADGKVISDVVEHILMEWRQIFHSDRQRDTLFSKLEKQLC